MPLLAAAAEPDTETTVSIVVRHGTQEVALIVEVNSDGTVTVRTNG